jgi:hypothetical protein
MNSNEERAIQLMMAKAREGTLMDGANWECPARTAWHACLSSGDERLERLAEEAQRLNWEARDRREYLEMSVEDVRAKARAEADEPYSQVVEEYALESLAKRAAELCPEREDYQRLAEEAADLADAERQAQANEQKALEQERAERGARIAPYREQAQQIIDASAVSGLRRPGIDFIAEKLADGDEKDARQYVGDWFEKELERERQGSPDTFGYCHGTDFEGGSW